MVEVVVEVEVEVGVEVEVMSELTEKRFRELKAEIEIVREESQRAQGALDQLMGRLKEEFDCSTLKEAKKELEKLTTERDKAEKEFEKALAAYETKWKNRE